MGEGQTTKKKKHCSKQNAEKNVTTKLEGGGLGPKRSDLKKNNFFGAGLFIVLLFVTVYSSGNY